MADDVISQFVKDSHAEPGPRSELFIKKEKDGAGFCVRAKGGKKAIAKLEKLLGDVDLGAGQE